MAGFRPTLDGGPFDVPQRERRGDRRPVPATRGAASARRSIVPGRHIALLVLVIGAAWVILVFGRVLSEANAIGARAAEARAENAALRAQLEAGRAEVSVIQADEFLRVHARAYGLGEPGERVFALRPGAPDPIPIVPLGAAGDPAAPASPLDEWLDLLFGSDQPAGGPGGASAGG
jgi:hypothetical protein